MIDVCFGSIFSCLTYSNLLRFPFFMKLAHRHLFAVLFSFQRTIALSDLISLSRHFSFVKQIFSLFPSLFSCRLPSDRRRILSYHFISFLSTRFFQILSVFSFLTHTYPFRRLRRHLPRQAGTAFLCESFRQFWVQLIYPFFHFCSHLLLSSAPLTL